jgi:hydrogenase-4 membrane subunit HyfE
MKIDIRHIIGDHLKTLRNAKSESVSIVDFFLFYVFPLAVAGLAYYFNLKFAKADIYNVSITLFGIFIALLLNVQVAIFSIFQRRWEPAKEERMQPHQDKKFDSRQALLGELNANLSYSILICCLALFAALLFFVKEWNTGVGPATIVFLYAHFILTLVMIVKRAHVLFHGEYSAP